MALSSVERHSNLLCQAALRDLALARLSCTHYTVRVRVADHDFPVQDLLLALLLERRVMLLLNVVLVAVEELLYRVPSQQQEALLLSLLALRGFVHVGVRQRRSRLCEKQKF